MGLVKYSNCSPIFRQGWFASLLLIVLIFAILSGVPAQAQEPITGSQPPVVQGILFWMEGCSHCEYVINQVLPPLEEKYGAQLDIQLVQLQDTAQVDQLYQAASQLGIPKENVGVPFLIVGDRALVGSEQIPAELPSLIEIALAAGGIAKPASPALSPLLETPAAGSEICEPTAPCAVGEATAQNAVGLQPAGPPAPAPETQQPQETRSNGFTLAVVILVGMVLAVIFSVFWVLRSLSADEPQVEVSSSRWQSIAVLLLALAGLGVAGYLTYIETTKIAAVCGPVGDCNSVQSSPYAYLFGVLPVGLLGLAGYVTILAAWLAGEWLVPRWKAYTWLAIFGMALFGTAFSIYLTYLEPFVINAVCIWCLISAVLITLILLLSASQARDSLVLEPEPLLEVESE
jgi:uncharacterized membrane protein